MVLLDREPLALRCAAASAAASGLANLSPSASVTGIPELLAELADVLPHTPARDGAAINHGTGGAGSSNGSSGSARGLSFDTPVGVELFDWNSTQLGRKFDVVLACDVLYEDAAVEPISAVVPKLLKGGGRLLLADPPKRTTRNRERFVSILGAQSPKLAPLECSVQVTAAGRGRALLQGGHLYWNDARETSVLAMSLVFLRPCQLYCCRTIACSHRCPADACLADIVLVVAARRRTAR